MAEVVLFPTSNTSYVGGGLRTPTNMHANDGSYATAAPAKNAEWGTAYANFGFDAQIPAANSINSVIVAYEYVVSTNASIAVGRFAARVSGTSLGNNDDTSEPTSDSVISTDITAARSWVRNDLLDGTFDVVSLLRRGNSNTAVTLSGDFVRVLVNHSAPPPASGSGQYYHGYYQRMVA